MPEPVSTASALIGIFKGLRDGLRSLREGNLSRQHQDAVEKMFDLLVDAQDRLSTLQQESIELRERNDKLRREISESDDWENRSAEFDLVKTEGGAVVYQRRHDPRRLTVAKGGGSISEGHYVCPVCFAKRDIQILQDLNNYAGQFECPSCSARYIINRPEQSPAHTVPGNYDPY